MVCMQVEVAYPSVIGQLIQAMALLFSEQALLLAEQLTDGVMILVDVFLPFFSVLALP